MKSQWRSFVSYLHYRNSGRTEQKFSFHFSSVVPFIYVFVIIRTKAEDVIRIMTKALCLMVIALI